MEKEKKKEEIPVANPRKGRNKQHIKNLHGLGERYLTKERDSLFLGQLKKI